MKSVVKALAYAVILVAAVLLLIRKRFRRLFPRSSRQTNSQPTVRISVDQQLQDLGDFGVQLREGCNLQSLTDDVTRDDLEAYPYRTLLFGLADLGLCDSACLYSVGKIQPHPGYAELLEQLEKMTGHALGLEDIRDNFSDIFAGTAAMVEQDLWLAEVSFQHDAHPLRWDCVYDFNYFDYNIPGRYNELLAAYRHPVRILCDEEGLFLALHVDRVEDFLDLTRTCPGFDLFVPEYDPLRHT